MRMRVFRSSVRGLTRAGGLAGWLFLFEEASRAAGVVSLLLLKAVDS